MSHYHKIQTRTVEVKDGTHPPSDAALRAAKEHKDNNKGFKTKRPHELGYKHAIGKTRFVERWAWFCSCGRSANGCTFPNEGSAKAAGLSHAHQSRKEKVA